MADARVRSFAQVDYWMSSSSTTSGAGRASLDKLQKHLTDPFTSRDIFGVVRGRCTEVRQSFCCLVLVHSTF